MGRAILNECGRRPATHYVSRYWRGELSLAHSFWITNCSLDLLTTLIDHVLESRMETSASPLRLHQMSTAFVFSYSFLLAPWQLVGLWRAARQYVRDHCSTFWGRCAQGLVVCSVLLYVGLLPIWAPYYLDMLKIAIGTEEYRYTVALSDDGNMLRIEGGISLGLTHTVTDLLKRHPQVEVIALNSHGGLLDESRKLQALIEQRGLSTYSDHHYESACALVFLVGAHRLLHVDAHLGFHRASSARVPDMMMQGENEQIKDFMLKHGVDQAFVEKAIETAPDNLWIPTGEELVQAGVVTEVVEGTQTPQPRVWPIGTTSPTPRASSSPTVVAFPNTPGGLSLTLPGFHMDADEMKADGRRYFMATHPPSGLVVSVTLERVPAPASRQGCIEHLARLKVGPFVVRGHDVRFDTTSARPRLEYTIAETQGVRVEQKNVRTCIAQDNIYGDIHLSKVQYRAVDAPLFDAVLDSIAVLEQSSAPSAPATSHHASSLQLFQQGSRYYLQNQYAQAIPFYQQAVNLEKSAPQLDKTLWRVLVDNLGMAYGMTGQLQEAKAIFEYGISLDPGYPMFHYNLACTFAEMNAMDDAMHALETAFIYKQNQNPGERMPDPRRDASFQRFMNHPDFRSFLSRLMAPRT